MAFDFFGPFRDRLNINFPHEYSCIQIQLLDYDKLIMRRDYSFAYMDQKLAMVLQMTGINLAICAVADSNAR
jgi:hypothetical protein